MSQLYITACPLWGTCELSAYDVVLAEFCYLNRKNNWSWELRCHLKRRIIYNAPEKVRQIHKYCNNALVRWGEVSTSACHSLRFIQIFTEAGRANGVRPGYYTRLACLYRCIQVIKLYILNFRVIHLEIKTCRTEFWNWNTVSVLARSCGEVILSSLSLCLRPPFSIVRTILSSLLEYPLYAATPQDCEKC